MKTFYLEDPAIYELANLTDKLCPIETPLTKLVYRDPQSRYLQLPWDSYPSQWIETSFYLKQT